MVQILDQFGRPLRRDDQALEEGQTARLGHLHRELADHPSLGLTPARLAATLEAAENGDLTAQHAMFLDMEEKDGHLFAEMSKRRRAVVGLPWRIVPPPNPTTAEKKLAAEVSEWVTEIPDLEDVQLDIMDACGHGFSALEMAWVVNQGVRLPTDIAHRPQSWFQLDRETRTRILLRDTTGQGEPLQQFTWVLHTHRAKAGYISRAGLHRVLAWPFLFKMLATRDLAELLEIYGIPMRLGTYGRNATPEEKSRLMAAVVGIGHRAAGIIPEGMQIDLKEAASGSHEPFLSFMEYMDRIESKAILGGTLNSGTDTGGSYAQGKIHENGAWTLTVSDAKQAAGTISRDLIYPICALNGRSSDPRRTPRWEYVTAESAGAEQLNTFSMGIERLAKLLGNDPSNGIPVSWVREQIGWPSAARAEDGTVEPVLTSPQAAPAAPAQTAAAGALSPFSPPGYPSDEGCVAPTPFINRSSPIAAAAARPNTDVAPADALDALVAEALGDWRPVLAPLVDPLQAVLDEAAAQGDTAKQVIDRLPGVLAQMDSAALHALLTRLGYTAKAAGAAGRDLE